MITLVAVALLVGMLIGSVGIGGILLIPALQMLAPLPIQAAMATALFTFIFTGIVGTVLFQRRGSVDWALTTPLCVGAALFGVVGAWANARLEAKVLALILALLIAAAGAYTLLTGSAQRAPCLQDKPARQRALLFAIGALTGFGSGLTGVGGPALSVPMMVMLGFPPLATVGASQVVQILAAASGSAGHLVHGAIDFKLAAMLVVFEVVGVYIGVHLAHAVNARTLRRGVGLLCIAVGAGLLIGLM